MSSLDQLVDRGVVRTKVEIGELTTYRLGGPARYLAEPADIGALQELVQARNGEPVLVLGRGSNLVISDRGFDGLVVRLTGEFERIGIDGETVTAGGAAWLPSIARQSVDRGLGGLEFCIGIPGTVGGAVRQNAGGHGSEISEWLISADILSMDSGMVTTSSAVEIEMSYRQTNVGFDQVVTEARFRTERNDRASGRELIASIVNWRKQHQPPAIYNAGSVFRNPDGDSAGRIIDGLGLKGFSMGQVRVSEKHANFFVAEPDATAADLHALVNEVISVVADRAGVTLVPEIEFVGDFS